MPVRITEIAISRLGPLEDGISFKPGMLNLIFGKNEKGKTCLVEFLVRSLFRNAKDWGLRDFKGAGRVMVQGLEDKTQAFSPSSPKKIEDFWDVVDSGLPPDFSRLLVVKGAEPDLSRSGADKTAIARFLSGVGLLDRILSPKVIPKTVQSAIVENGTILGDAKGEIKDRNEIEKRLKGLNGLFDLIDKEYSGGVWKKLSDEKESVADELAVLAKARQHMAFRMAGAMNALEKEKSVINENAVKELRRKVFEHQQMTGNQKRRRMKQAETEKKSLHYEWLKSAREQYRGMLNEKAPGSGIVWQAAALFLILVSTAFLSTGFLIPALVCLAAALACGAVYLVRSRAALRTVVRSKELEALRHEFENRFGVMLSSLTHIEEILTKIEPDYYENVSLKKQIIEGEKDVESLRGEIFSGFSKLSNEALEPTSWNAVLEAVENKLKSLSEGIQDKRVELARLNVDGAQYEQTDPGHEYDPKREKQLGDRMKQIDADLGDIHKRLTDLKQRMCHETGDDISIPWPDLVWHLKSKLEEVSKLYRDKTAEMLAKIAVVQVAESIRKDESAKIEAGLNAPAMLNLLKSMTRRYDRLLLDGEMLHVSDPYQEFNFTDLSTGAREQVLLALRIGFASMLSKRDKLFLVLDDAFQHSDWDRREGLVETVATLAEQGWQVFYFTMDDHLRGLFDAKGKGMGKEYVSLTL